MEETREPTGETRSLRKELTLLDVYSISTGAMFSAGFFLLPSLAAAKTGSSVVLAYIVAAVICLPAMFSKAELATAMPRTGGAYYFLDRAMGPIVGAIGGLGAWLGLVLKSAFVLIGMGAYVALLLDVPAELLAVGFVLALMLINLLGARKARGMQRALVLVLVGFTAYFIVEGVVAIVGIDRAVTRARMTPFFEHGATGFFATVGFCFVAFAGLTKVTSVAEDVEDPDRNLPLGMFLSLFTSLAAYVIGVAIMLAVVPSEAMHGSLTPVADAAVAVLRLPGRLGLYVAVVAAFAAFLSTGHAGLMSSSRYPFAMARDALMPAVFARLGRFGTPTWSILVTSVLMIAFIVGLGAESVVMLASAFQLLLFALLNVAVIVMRESRIDYYRPGYRSPLYPWLQIVGCVACLALIYLLGALAMLVIAIAVVLCIAWYFAYARSKVTRGGAIFHVFERLGREAHVSLDHELRGILTEKGLHDEDPFEEIVTRAVILELDEELTFDGAVYEACLVLAEEVGIDPDEIRDRLTQESRLGLTPVSHGVAVPHLRIADLVHPQLVIVRSRHPDGIRCEDPVGLLDDQPLHTVVLLVSPDTDAGQHLRILAQLAGRVDDDDFSRRWRKSKGAARLKEALLRDERFVNIRLRTTDATSELIDKTLLELQLPPGALIALVRRLDDTIVPRASTRLHEGDRLTFIGSPESIEALYERYK